MIDSKSMSIRKQTPYLLDISFITKYKAPPSQWRNSQQSYNFLPKIVSSTTKMKWLESELCLGQIQTKCMREKLIMEGAEFTLDKAIQIARTYEKTQAQLKSMSPENKEESIHLVRDNHVTKSTPAIT